VAHRREAPDQVQRRVTERDCLDLAPKGAGDSSHETIIDDVHEFEGNAAAVCQLAQDVRFR